MPKKGSKQTGLSHHLAEMGVLSPISAAASTPKANITGKKHFRSTTEQEEGGEVIIVPGPGAGAGNGACDSTIKQV